MNSTDLRPYGGAVLTMFILTALLAAGAVCSASADEAFKAHLVCREIALAKAMAGMIPDSVKGSPDGRHVAYRVKQNEREILMVDGIAGKPYDQIVAFQFSPDGARCAYIARLAEKKRVVTDGKEGKAYDGIEWFDLHFSRDGRHIGFIARSGTFDAPDAYAQAVVDEKEGAKYALISDLEFSPDAKHTAFRFQQLHQVRYEADMQVAVDGVAKDASMVRCRFGPDGRHVAYAIRRAKKMVVELDGKTIGKECDLIDMKGVFFSPDGKRTAYWTKDGDDWRVVVDGVAQNAYPRKRVPMGPDNMEPITFSPDSKHVAYPAGQVAVIDGVETERYNVVYDSVVYSPDGKRLAFAALRDRECIIVLDGKHGKPYTQVYTPQFSPDSLRLAYMVWNSEGDTWQSVVDGIAGPKYQKVGGTRFAPDDAMGCFSPDSRHFAYKASRKGKWILAVDGTESKEFDEFVPGTGIVFDTPTTFHVLARRGDAFLRIEGQIL